MIRRVDPGTPSSWSDTVAAAAEALRRDEVVLLPAEGLYGFHARADREEALAALQRVKPREGGRGWIVLVPPPPAKEGGPSPTARRLADFPPAAEALAREHWPGPLTLVLRAAPDVSESLRAGDGTIALRCPGSEFLLEVLKRSDCPLVSTSANAPGASPPSRFEDCPRDGVGFAVDGGTLSGLPSTVVRVDGSTVRVLRSGALKVEGEAP